MFMLQQRRAPLLYLGHHSAVKGLLTPRENLAWHVSGAGDWSDADIDDALARVGLCGYEDVASHTLSAGQHRRVKQFRTEPFRFQRGLEDRLGVVGARVVLSARLESAEVVGVIPVTNPRTPGLVLECADL